MTEYERSRTMPALPEHVFDLVADVDRLDAWFPAELRVAGEDRPGTVQREGTGEDPSAAPLRVRQDELRLEWGTAERDGRTGWLGVEDLGSGASEVTVHLSIADSGQDPGERAVEAALDSSLRRLEEQVRLRIDNAAG
jgi:uncharacterized protein YndB with AHSA1/START domain